jgi:hypothetical protein
MECGLICLAFTLLFFLLIFWDKLTKMWDMSALDFDLRYAGPPSMAQTAPEKVVIHPPIPVIPPEGARVANQKTIHEVREEIEGLPPSSEEGERLRDAIIAALSRMEQDRSKKLDHLFQRRTWTVGSDGMPTRKPVAAMTREEYQDYLGFWSLHGGGGGD